LDPSWFVFKPMIERVRENSLLKEKPVNLVQEEILFQNDKKNEMIWKLINDNKLVNIAKKSVSRVRMTSEDREVEKCTFKP